MSEECRVPEVIAHGICDLEIIDGVFHCVFYTVRDTHTGKPWNEPLLRIAIPVSNVPKCIEQALAAIALGSVSTVLDATRRAFMH